MPLPQNIVALIAENQLITQFPTYYENIPINCTMEDVGTVVAHYSQHFAQIKDVTSIEKLMLIVQQRFQPNIQMQRKKIIEVEDGTITQQAYLELAGNYGKQYQSYIAILSALEKQWQKAQVDKASSSTRSAMASSTVYAYEINAHASFSASIRRKNITFLAESQPSSPSSPRKTDLADQFSIAQNSSQYETYLEERAGLYRNDALQYKQQSAKEKLNTEVVDRIFHELNFQRSKLTEEQASLNSSSPKFTEHQETWYKRLAFYREMHTRFVEILDIQITSFFGSFQNSHSRPYQNEINNHETFEQAVMRWEGKIAPPASDCTINKQTVESATADMKRFVTQVLDGQDSLSSKIYLLQKVQEILYGEHDKDHQKILKETVQSKLTLTREQFASSNNSKAPVNAQALEQYRDLHTLSLWVLNTHRDYRRKVAFGEEPTGSYKEEVDAHQNFERGLLDRARAR